MGDYIEDLLTEASNYADHDDYVQGRVILRLTSGRTIYGTVSHVGGGAVSLDPSNDSHPDAFLVHVRLSAIETVEYAEDAKDGAL